MKRHVAFGPGGTGMIYRIDTTTNTVRSFLDLGVFGTGADPHPATNAFLPWFHDSNSFDAVGKIGLGGMVFDETNDTLYAVNLANKHLYRIPVGNPPTPPSAANIRSFATPTNGRCPSTNDIRPFGLGIDNRGIIYLGEVCSAQSSGLSSDLRAFVYTFDPATNLFGAAPVLDFPLNYPRICVDHAPACPIPQDKAPWRPWIDTFSPALLRPDGYGGHPQPMLISIAFDGPDMVLGFRDRFADQAGRNAGSTDPADPARYNAIPAGDTLRACSNGAGGFTLENNATCGARTTAGAGNNQGPGGGEFYFADNVPGFHDEVSLGSVATVQGLPEVVSTVFDPNNVLFTGGVRWWNKDTAVLIRGYQLYSAAAAGTFGKANGLGSLAVLCQAPREAPAPAVAAQANATEVRTPHLAMTKDVNLSLAIPGDSVTFTIRVSNTGNAPAVNNVVVDTVPDPLIVTSASAVQGTATRAGNMVTFAIATINPGQTVTLTIGARIPLDVQAPLDITNTAFLQNLSAPAKFRITRGTLPVTGEHPDSSSNVASVGLVVSLVATVGVILWARRHRASRQTM